MGLLLYLTTYFGPNFQLKRTQGYRGSLFTDLFALGFCKIGIFRWKVVEFYRKYDIIHLIWWVFDSDYECKQRHTEQYNSAQ